MLDFAEEQRIIGAHSNTTVLENHMPQEGSIRESHGSWFLRYYEDVLNDDGKPGRARRSIKLARVDEKCPSIKWARQLAAPYLAPLQAPTAVEGALMLSQYVEKFFLPYITLKKKYSTVRSYKMILEVYVLPRCGDIPLRAFRTVDCQKVLDGVEGPKGPLSHQSLLRIKSCMSAVFSHAIRTGVLGGTNPIRESRAEGGTRTRADRYAYTLPEITKMIRVLPEPARTIVAVCAFSGTRESELKGLKWEDDKGSHLLIQRSIFGWHTTPEETKTEASKNSVPIIPALRVVLDAHKRNANGNAWMFHGEKKGLPLNLDNLSRRVIKPILGDKWHGWHAFRAGLATNLFDLRVPAETIQLIMRHSNVSVTQQHYIRQKQEREGAAAMKLLQKAFSAKGKRGANGAHRQLIKSPKRA
jgi:integrase